MIQNYILGTDDSDDWNSHLSRSTDDSCLIECSCSWINSQNMSSSGEFLSTRRIIPLGERYNARYRQLVLPEVAIAKINIFQVD